MFGKKKKQPKVEKLFDDAEQAGNSSEMDQNEELNKEQLSDADELILGIDKSSDDEFKLTDAQKNKVEKLDSVKDKISKILQSQNIEIVDENFGDEFESDYASDSDERKQQDYDSLKALFGSKDKVKADELTLTIDDFDYTYVGQYIDEFDLMHAKNIKRIKLKKKYPKHLKKIIIAASVVLVVGLGAFFGFYFTRDIPVYLKSVTLSQTENVASKVYLNDKFEYEELYIIAEYSNGKIDRIPLTSSHLSRDEVVGVYKIDEDTGDIYFTGGSLCRLTFNYKGKSMVYTVNISKKDLEGVLVFPANDLFSLQSGSYVTEDYLKVALKYNGINDPEKVSFNLSGLKFYVDNGSGSVEMRYNSANKGFLLTEDITDSSKIKIEYSGKQIEFSKN